MQETKIAKCGNCGAALRIGRQSTSGVTCDYCGIESKLEGNGDTAAPRLRIDAPPPLKPEIDLRAFAAISTLLGLAALAYTLVAYRQPVPIGLAFVVLLVGIVAAVLEVQERRKLAEHQWFRDNGLPGKATVESIRSGQGRNATLALKIELMGRPEWRCTHAVRDLQRNDWSMRRVPSRPRPVVPVRCRCR